MLFLDGVYAEDDYVKNRFHRIKSPNKSEITVPHLRIHAPTALVHPARYLLTELVNGLQVF